MQQGSSAAALTVINTRDILLQSMAAELAKEAHVQHEVWLGCHSNLSNRGQGESKRCIHCSARALETPRSRPCCYEEQHSCPHSLPRMQEVTALRAQMAVLGAAALQRQGFLDAAQEILLQYRGSAGSSAAARHRGSRAQHSPHPGTLASHSCALRLHGQIVTPQCRCQKDPLYPQWQ